MKPQMLSKILHMKGGAMTSKHLKCLRRQTYYKLLAPAQHKNCNFVLFLPKCWSPNILC